MIAFVARVTNAADKDFHPGRGPDHRLRHGWHAGAGKTRAARADPHRRRHQTGRRPQPDPGRQARRRRIAQGRRGRLGGGRRAEDIIGNVVPVLAKAVHKKFGVPYVRTAYQPMRELLACLEANGFTNWICSGSPILMTREISMEMFGVSPERVMGSYVGNRLEARDGRTVLVFNGRLENLNDQEGKPVTLARSLSKRPVFFGGNEGRRGDIAVMLLSKNRKGPSFQALINHDDAERAFAYSEPDNYSLTSAEKYGFHVGSIKDDWKTIIKP